MCRRAWCRPCSGRQRGPRPRSSGSAPSWTPGWPRRQHATADAAARLRSSSCSSTEFSPMAPRIMPVAGAGFVALWLARRLLGPDAHAGDLQTVLRGLPHNVTTEMDLELWHARPPACASDEVRSHAEATSCDGLPGSRTATAPSPRSTSACRAGPTTRATSSACSRTTCGWTRPRRAKASPDRLFAAGAAEAEAMIDTLRQPGRPPARRAGSRAARPHPSAGRDARAAEVLLRPDHRRRPRELGTGWARSCTAWAASPSPTTSTSSTSPRHARD